MNIPTILAAWVLVSFVVAVAIGALRPRRDEDPVNSDPFHGEHF